MNVNLTPNITGKNVNIIKGATQADLTNSVNNSKIYRDEAEAFSIVSEAKSVEASYSALNASISSTTASDKATIATTKANEASSSAYNANNSAIDALSSKNSATASASSATLKASEASSSATVSANKASEASTSASNALTSENNAYTSEANALIYRNQAESFANSINNSDLVHISGTETITGDKTFSGTVSGLTKATVGLSNVDNTSDANKPISTATQNALNTKVDTSTNQTIAGVKTFSSTISGSISGNAGTATKLATARTIQIDLGSAGGASFDGTVNVTPGVTGTLAVLNGGTGATTVAGALANIVGYTPIQQGGGTSQYTNKLFIGWGGASLNLQVDGTNFASTWPISISGTAATVTNGVYTTGNQTINGVKTFSSSPIVPTPTTGTQAVNKDYVDSVATLNINALSEKITPSDTDNLAIQEAGGLLKKLSWANLKATLLTYFDTFYSRTTNIFGIGQSITDVTSLRTKGSTYTNYTNKTIFVMIKGAQDGTTTAALYINGVIIMSSGVSTDAVWFPVPSGQTYNYSDNLGGTNAYKWIEYR